MANNFDLILALLELALKYGIPAVKNIIDTWNDDMTPAEIEVKIKECQSRLKRPETYFE